MYDDIRKRLEAATAGPWFAGRDVQTGMDYAEVRRSPHGLAMLHIRLWGDGADKADADADLIAHAPEDLQALLGEVDRLRDGLRDIIERETDDCGACDGRTWALVALLEGTA